jgi:exodeoxyribonuclease V alpha subunit
MNLLIYAANHLSEKRQTTLSLRLGGTIQASHQEEDDDDISPYDFM